MHAVSDVTVNNQWIQQTGKAGAMFTKSGQPVRFVVEGTYQGTTKMSNYRYNNSFQFK